MTTFAMHYRFYKRLTTIYRDPERAAHWLKDRTAKQRKAKGFEVPKLCDEYMRPIR